MEDEFVTDMINLLNSTKDDIPYIIGAIFILFLLAYIIPRAAFFIYEMNTPEAIQQFIQSVIYKLDELADEFSNKHKRDEAINRIHGILLFRGIIIPKFICGWIIDFEVQYIRNLQRNCIKDSDLHKISDLNR